MQSGYEVPATFGLLLVQIREFWPFSLRQIIPSVELPLVHTGREAIRKWLKRDVWSLWTSNIAVNFLAQQFPLY